MYNETLKQEYLRSLKDDTKKHTTTRLFVTTTLREQLLNKDVYSLNQEELISVLRYTIGIQYAKHEAIQKAVKDVREYKEWVKVNYPNKNVFDIPKGCITPKDIDCEEIYPYKFFKNGTDMLQTLQQIFNDGTTKGLRIILTYLLLFNGIPLDKISFIKKDQISFINHSIVIGNLKTKANTSISMIPEFIPIYQQVFELSIYQGERNREPDKDFFFPMSSNNNTRAWRASFAREVKDYDITSQKVFNENFQKKLPTQLDRKLIEINGVIYRTYLTKTTGISYASIFDKYSKDLNDIYNTFVKTFYC